MGGMAKKPNKKNKNKVVNQNVVSNKKTVQKNDQPKSHEKKKPLKLIKKNNVKNEVKISKTAQVLAKKIQQNGRNNTKSAAVDLLNPNVAKVTKNRPNNPNTNNKTGTALQTNNNKKGVKSKQNGPNNKNSKQIQAENKGQSSNKTKNIKGEKEKSENMPQTKSQAAQFKKQRKKAKWKNENKLLIENVKPLNKKKQKQDQSMNSNKAHKGNNDLQVTMRVPKLNIKRLEEMLTIKKGNTRKRKQVIKTESLRDRMMSKLRASRFRFLNETLYNNESTASKKYFKEDPDAFKAYHDGYKQQIEQWPLNPLDTIIAAIKKMPKDHIIADFGCGEARLASSISQKVHSFDFISLNEKVTACDMAHTPLLTGGVHVVVFCLSLMGTNLGDYLTEANRVLKKDGMLKIAEVESRFDKVEDFISLLSEYGFKNTWTDLSHNLFYFLDFKKEKDVAGKRNKLPAVTLKPCLYKKR